MYKLLLSWRYLRTRFIALASIVSVTLGVATLIVVNSVMAGFIDEMQCRLHGILSDVEIATPGLDEIVQPELHVVEIDELVGDDLQAVTYVVRVPALLTFEFHGRQWTQTVVLLGIDEATFGRVTDFSPYLLNEIKKQDFSFHLEEAGYDSRLGQSGWPYRRSKAANQKQIEGLLRQYSGNGFDQGGPATHSTDSGDPHRNSELSAIRQTVDSGSGVQFTPLPDHPPNLKQTLQNSSERESLVVSAFDPHSEMRPQLAPEEMFDPSRDQHTGVILGLAISNRSYIDPVTGEAKELYMLRPGDDVQITLPTAGPNPSPICENCTVVDFYASNMHEYDASFAFMPLRQLQAIRGMVDPLTGSSSVSAIQVKLRDGADLNRVRDDLIAKFPPDRFPYDIHTWQDAQAPLLSAVNLELTILNMLLFLIIAVAGFGILATFFMIVVEKTKDIGILKALGAPSSGVMAIFMNYGLSLGAVGTGAGIVIGCLFVLYINEIADVIQFLTGREIFDPTIYYFSEIPTIVSPWMIACVAAGAMAIAVLASVLPAIRAARLHPVEALRYE
jgi:lipoprotein-releasing system permease protein